MKLENMLNMKLNMILIVLMECAFLTFTADLRNNLQLNKIKADDEFGSLLVCNIKRFSFIFVRGRQTYKLDGSILPGHIGIK